jgi:serine/threonine protein kinase/S1-C subfamily serine protease
VSTENTVLRVCQTCGNQVESGDATCPRDGGPIVNQSNDPMIGSLLLDKYHITELLGRGGMSAVYKARHVLMDRWVAIKFLRSELVDDPNMLKRFQHESKAISMLKHPNVMTCHDFGLTPDGIPYLVMDFIEGKTLTQVLAREGQLVPTRGVNLFCQICDALDHCHKKGVVHRDIKPGNLIIVINEDGTESIRLVDFGIAKLLEREGVELTKLTNAGDVLGSPAYMSPEQCCGRPIDVRSDIYALGCVIYESLTGTPALRGASAIETMLKHVNDYPPGFKEVRPDLNLSEHLQAVVFRALAKDPPMRQQTMLELKGDLQNAIAQDGGYLVPVRQSGSGSGTLPPQPVAEPSKLTAFGLSSGQGFQTRGTVETAEVVSAADNSKVSEQRVTLSSQVMPSLDLFGNAVIPMADQSGGTTSGATVSDKGDSGGLFSQPEEKVQIRTGIDSGDLFGNEKLLPAVSDSASSPPSVVDSGPVPGGDRGSMFGDSGSLYGDRNAAQTTTSGQTVNIGLDRKPGINPIVIASVAGVAFLALIAMAATAYFLLKPASNAPTAPPDVTPAALTGVKEQGGMDANQVFKTCKPSIVTLKVLNHCFKVRVRGLDLTEYNQEPGSKVVAAPGPGGKITLFRNCQPAESVKGVLATPKGTANMLVTLQNGAPRLILLDDNFQVVNGKDGRPMFMQDGVELVPYDMEVGGTGFFVRPDIVATNCHVACPANAGEAGFAGGTAQVFDKKGKMLISDKPLIIDQLNDVALLYVPGTDAKPLPMQTDYSKLAIGQRVFALGSPEFMDASITQGIISADKLRDEPPNHLANVFLQHSAKIDHGNSGGPLIDTNGQVIGINQGMMGNGAVNLAVVARCIEVLLDKPSVQEKMRQLDQGAQTDLRGGDDSSK